MINVRAKQMCFVDGFRRRVGEVFTIESMNQFSERAMTLLDEPKKGKGATPAKGKGKGAPTPAATPDAPDGEETGDGEGDLT